MADSPPPLPLYYQGKTLADMLGSLRGGYLKQSGWLESAERKLALRDGKPVPWFTYGAIDFLERELTSDLSMFEYGGGQSTLYWANRLRRVVSVDHDPAFVDLVRRTLPAHAEFRLLPENTPLPEQLVRRSADMPVLADPEYSVQTWRSGQLNAIFACYALQVLDFPDNSFDVVVVDGMARNLSTWAAIRHFRKDGFIVFDNSDRDFYRPAYDMLADAGYRRIDFRGLGPINPYEWCTSVFYEHRSFTDVRWFADKNVKPAPILVPALAPAPRPAARYPGETGVLVLGFNRGHHLQAVLESLRLQNRLASTHVWIDGTKGRGEYLQANDHSIEIAGRYAVRELHTQWSHSGIEKMMLEALAQMCALYDRFVVLEDDCFPAEGAITAFEATLDQIADRPDMYSAYGHFFGNEAADNRDFTRFQGWGWAAHSDRVAMLLPEMRSLFMLGEQEYRETIAARMTDEIRTRLDCTPGRDVLRGLGKSFSWDSATAFLTAERGLSHRRTGARVVFNTGITPGIGHFRSDIPKLRQPPFNLITLPEAWDHYDRKTPRCPANRPSYGLDELDLKIIDALGDHPPGFLIEIGAHDGVLQSNSVLLEARGWKGLLIEASPGKYARCRKARPGMLTEHAACVAQPPPGGHVTLTEVGLMSMTEFSVLQGDEREVWLQRGEGFARHPRQEIEVRACTMSSLLDKHAVNHVDLLLLDVEGAEIDVLGGLDFTRHAPGLIVAEDNYDSSIADYLAHRGYVLDRILLERKYTRDILYRRQRAP